MSGSYSEGFCPPFFCKVVSSFQDFNKDVDMCLEGLHPSLCYCALSGLRGAECFPANTKKQAFNKARFLITDN